MRTSTQYVEGIKSIAVIGNYLPRQCGIATFTRDLVEGLSARVPDTFTWAVAMNDRIQGYDYPEKVRFEINQNKLADYHIAAQFLDISQTDIVCLQHEFGIFGGPAGSHLLKLLSDLHMPLVTTLHTVLIDPSDEYRTVMIKLGELSDKLVVMSHKAKSFLHDIYGITEEKIAFIHHGIPDMPFIDSSFHKDKFRVEGKKVLLTFGLLSPNKGIETVLQALPAVIEKFPDVVYIILGATHPHVLKTKGEAYRIMLQQIAHNLNISDHVIFQNNFVALRELCDFLGIADIYITPYLEEAQITSGTLVYAMGTGRPLSLPLTGMPLKCWPRGGGKSYRSTNQMQWQNKSMSCCRTIPSGIPCAKRHIPSPVKPSGKKFLKNILTSSTKSVKTASGIPGPGIPMLEISKPSPVSICRR